MLGRTGNSSDIQLAMIDKIYSQMLCTISIKLSYLNQIKLAQLKLEKISVLNCQIICCHHSL